MEKIVISDATKSSSLPDENNGLAAQSAELLSRRPSHAPIQLVAHNQDKTPPGVEHAHGSQTPHARHARQPETVERSTPVAERTAAHDNGGSYSHRLDSYWSRLTTARHHHQTVSEFPPVHPGIDKPMPPTNSPEPLQRSGTLPTLIDLIGASKDLSRISQRDGKHPDFQLRELPESTFKQRYAEESLRVGRQYGLNNNQVSDLVRRIYSFEDGGWGKHFTMSGMPQPLMDDSNMAARMLYHPVSTAIGYNQLIIANTKQHFKDDGSEIAGRLRELGKQEPDRSQELEDKAQLVENLQKIMLGTAAQPAQREGKNRRQHVSNEKISNAVQALNLDGDVGPIIQSQELASLLKFSSAHNFRGLLEIKAQNIGRQTSMFDALPKEQKSAAVQEIMQRVVPAETHPTQPDLDKPFDDARNKLRDKFDAIQPGLDPSVLRSNLTDDERKLMNTQILTMRKFGGEQGSLSPNAIGLLDKITASYVGGITADTLMPAAIELANLAGMENAEAMLRPENARLPTANFFQRRGYEANPITNRRSADELLMQINRIMYGPNSDAAKPGVRDFDEIFRGIGRGSP